MLISRRTHAVGAVALSEGGKEDISFQIRVIKCSVRWHFYQRVVDRIRGRHLVGSYVRDVLVNTWKY
jgi:hypothetical protein